MFLEQNFKAICSCSTENMLESVREINLIQLEPSINHEKIF